MSATAEQTTAATAAAPPPPADAAASPGKSTTMAALKAPATPESQLPEVSAGFTSLRAFELLQRAGKALASASIVPETYRNNLGNCVIALEMAQRIGASPLMVMQNLYIVYGRPAWSAKFLIACFNQCGRFSAVRYIWSGTRNKDDWGCQAWAIEKSTGEKILGPVITMELVKAEGWYNRKDTKWKTIPEKMFMYRAAAWMIDTHAPELSMGIRTDDEIQDAFVAHRGSDGEFAVDLDQLRTQTQLAPAPTGAPDPTPPLASTWAATLRGATSIAQLDEMKGKCKVAFNGAMPMECDAAYDETKEALGEREGKQLDL